ncbi:hypothetical protein [Streptomyces shaanxiensis]
MSLDTPQTETRREQLTAHEALQRLEHERTSRLTQLRAIEETRPDAEEQVMSTQKDTIRRVLAEVEAAVARVGKAATASAATAPSRSACRVDTEGKLTDAPLTPQQVRDRAIGYAVLAAMTVALLGAAAYAYAHHRLERHNLAGWDAAWARTAPRWTASR